MAIVLCYSFPVSEKPNCLPLECGLYLVTHFWKTESGRSHHVSFPRICHKKTCFHAWLVLDCLFEGLVAMSWRNSSTSVERSHDKKVRPPAKNRVRAPSWKQVLKLQSSFHITAALANVLPTIIWEMLSQHHLAKLLPKTRHTETVRWLMFVDFNH